MRLFNKIAIIGTGLIGGSFALAVKRKGLAKCIVGVSRRKATLVLAKKLEVIDCGSQNLSIVKDADLVVLATPVDKIVPLAKKIRKIIHPECIVMDVGSTKAQVVPALDKIFPNFIGTHPMAGSEKRGVANINPNLFVNSLCILTPSKKTRVIVRGKIANLWKKIGARVVVMPSDKHDKALSFVSHLPHIVAFSLIGAVPREYLSLAASGLKDTTRIAASEAEIWQAIFLSNRKNALKAINSFEANLSKIKSALRNNDAAGLTRILKLAKAKREALL